MSQTRLDKTLGTFLTGAMTDVELRTRTRKSRSHRHCVEASRCLSAAVPGEESCLRNALELSCARTFLRLIGSSNSSSSLLPGRPSPIVFCATGCFAFDVDAVAARVARGLKIRHGVPPSSTTSVRKRMPASPAQGTRELRCIGLWYGFHPCSRSGTPPVGVSVMICPLQAKPMPWATS